MVGPCLEAMRVEAEQRVVRGQERGMVQGRQCGTKCCSWTFLCSRARPCMTARRSCGPKATSRACLGALLLIRLTVLAGFMRSKSFRKSSRGQLSKVRFVVVGGDIPLHSPLLPPCSTCAFLPLASAPRPRLLFSSSKPLLLLLLLILTDVMYAYATLGAYSYSPPTSLYSLQRIWRHPPLLPGEGSSELVPGGPPGVPPTIR